MKWYARGDLNPYPFGMEPKSIVYANFTTGAYRILLKKPIAGAIGFYVERLTRLELATSTLARWRSTG